MKSSLQTLGVPLVAGLVGFGVTLLLTGGSGSAVPDAGNSVDAGTLLAVYQRAEEYDKPEPIEKRLTQLFSQPYSNASDAEINALFQRLAVIDMQRAIRIAGMPGFDAALLAEVFRTLNEADAYGVLNLLADIDDRMMQIDLAVVLASVLDYESAALSRITAVLRPEQEVGFLAAVMGDLAMHDPAEALRRAVRLSDSGARNAAVQRVGRQSVLVDPEAALGRADDVPDILRQSYRDAVLLEWAQLDVAAFLAFADAQEVLSGLEAGLTHALAVDPANTYRVASRHPPLRMTVPLSSAFTLETIAFANAAEQDPEGYRVLLDAVTDEARKAELTQAFAEVFARQRPEQALAWARTIENPFAEMQVIAAVASVDHDLAIEWMIEFHERRGSLGLMQQAAQVLAQHAAGTAPAALASGLLARVDHPATKMALSALIENWVAVDPGGALEWIRVNPEQIDQEQIAMMAIRLSATDAAKAAEYTDLLALENRQVWLEQIADAYAFQDAKGAVTWLSQFQGEPEYETVLRRVLERIARVSPRDATELMTIAPVEMQRATAAEIASWLLGDSFEDAGRWALSVDDDRARQNALDKLAVEWASRAPDAAQRWVLGLPEGADRDNTLNSMLTRLSSDGYHVAIRPDLFDAFDSGALRDSAVERVVMSLAQQDTDRAESFIDRVITDRDLRRRAEATLEQLRLNRG